jgi:hypothetical protein
MIMKQIKIVYILGSGHCGSTLLNNLLDAHKDIIGLGEVSMLDFRNEQSDSWKKSRGASIKKLKGIVNFNLGHPCDWKELLSWDAHSLKKWRTNNRLFFELVATCSKAKIIVDASKNAKRLFLLGKSGFDVKVINMIRDGRAVVNSYVRREKGFKAFKRGIYYWKLRNNDSFFVKRFFAKRDWIDLRYEDFVLSPINALKSVCKLIGVEFNKRMLKINENNKLVYGNKWEYLKSHDSIVLDERWKREFPLYYRILFAVVAGSLNRKLGYHALK